MNLTDGHGLVNMKEGQANKHGKHNTAVDTIEKGTLIKVASATIGMQTADGKQTLYTVGTGLKFIPTHVIIRNPTASLAGGTNYDIGNGANADTWKQDIDLSKMTDTNGYYIVTQNNTGQYSQSGISESPSESASESPSVSPSESPSVSPTPSPSESPSESPSASVFESPSISPSESPSQSPSPSPSESPSASPSESPSAAPSGDPLIVFDAADVFAIKPITGSSANADATIEVFGYVYDA